MGSQVVFGICGVVKITGGVAIIQHSLLISFSLSLAARISGNDVVRKMQEMPAHYVEKPKARTKRLTMTRCKCAHGMSMAVVTAV